LIETANILAIESAVAGGSVAVIRGQEDTVATREGLDCSRAEKLLSIISELLNEANVQLGDIDLIAVSTGPGSYSGIRIGISTALGLSNALNLQCAGVSVLDAIASEARISSGSFIVAIPVGKNDVAWRGFSTIESGEHRPSAPSQLLSSESFIDQLNAFKDTPLLAHTDLLQLLSGRIPETTPWVDAGASLAESVGRFAARQDPLDRSVRPIYLRNKDRAVGSAGF
jgi:tRNA threonylcarbamoyladenosine biosynthesis protein TsaB